MRGGKSIHIKYIIKYFTGVIIKNHPIFSDHRIIVLKIESYNYVIKVLIWVVCNSKRNCININGEILRFASLLKCFFILFRALFLPTIKILPKPFNSFLL